MRVWVPDWRYVPGRGRDHPIPLVRIYCEGCETFSRPVRPPKPGSGLNPDPPKGWESGCPRCGP